MRWSVAIKLALKMTVVFVVLGLLGFILAGVGGGLLISSRDSGLLEEERTRRVFTGMLVIAAGAVWLWAAAAVVLLKYLSQGIYETLDPVLSDMYTRVIYIQQMLPQSAQPWRQPQQPSPASSEPTADEQWSRTSPPEPGG